MRIHVRLLLRIPIFLPATQRSICGPRGRNKPRDIQYFSSPRLQCHSIRILPVSLFTASAGFLALSAVPASESFRSSPWARPPGVLVGVRRQGWTNSERSCEWYVRALARDESDASEEDGRGRGGLCTVMEARTNERMRESGRKTTQITSTLDRRVG
jgi:hypothetical protein